MNSVTLNNNRDTNRNVISNDYYRNENSIIICMLNKRYIIIATQDFVMCIIFQKKDLVFEVGISNFNQYANVRS